MQNRLVVRNVLKGAGVVLALIFVGGASKSGWLLTLGLIALFLGVTDFGRQCPLILSARHLAYRIRSKGTLPILSAKPIENVGDGDRKQMLS